ncbi:hypothetical protein GQ457_05G024820 [Hibiscus cannabinus]
MWKPNAIKLIHIGNDYFLATFQSRDDFLNALADGPWIVFGHYLIVEPWMKDFSSSQPYSRKIMVLLTFLVSQQPYTRATSSLKLENVLVGLFNWIIKLNEVDVDVLRTSQLPIGIRIEQTTPYALSLDSTIIMDENVDPNLKYMLIDNDRDLDLQTISYKNDPQDLKSAPCMVQTAHTTLMESHASNNLVSSDIHALTLGGKQSLVHIN